MTPSRFLSAAEFACKTVRSIVRGSGAPVLPPPNHPGAEALTDKEAEDEVLAPWWVQAAVDAKARAETPLSATFDDEPPAKCTHSYGDLVMDPDTETGTCKCGVKFLLKVFGHVADAPSPFAAAVSDEVPRCTNCDKRLGEIAASSEIFPGSFCSARCVSVAEVRQALKDSRTQSPAHCAPATGARAVEETPGGLPPNPPGVQPRCKFCQQQISQLEDGLWFHLGRNLLRCVDIPDFPPTYAQPE